MTANLRLPQEARSRMTPRPAFDYDVLVIGSGFGGSVTALRLTEKGYRVGVLEAGAAVRGRGPPQELLASSEVPLSGPSSAATASSASTRSRDCLILSGAGVGGGSLVYANTLYEPLAPFYDDPQWGHITDWKAELAPYYDQAKRMLGVVENPLRHPGRRGHEAGRRRDGRGRHVPPHAGRRVLRRRGAGMGRRSTTRSSAAPGPSATPASTAASCMTGCRHNAKNTLVKNYLHLAEQAGAEVHPLTTVTRVAPARRRRLRRSRRPLHEGQGRPAYAAASAHRRAGRVRGLRARHPAAAAPDAGRGPPAATSRTGSGYLSRTNSESIGGVDRAAATTSTTARASRSPRRSTPTSTPTSSRSATARAPTRCRCCSRCSPTATATSRAGGPGCARCGAQRRDSPTCTT